MKSDESGMGGDESAQAGTNRADSGTNQRGGFRREPCGDSRRVARRRFIAATGTVVLAAPARRAAAAPSPDRIRVGAIGVGGRGRLLLDQLPDDAQLVALADCNLPRAEAYAKDHAAKHGTTLDVVQDHRRLLDRQDIDAVIVATGEFQRVLPCIHACQAGKDIYAEKPLTLTVQEGRALVGAVRRHGRVLQVGTQQRSMAINRLACEFVRSGGLGTIREVRAVNYHGSAAEPVPPPAAEAVPAGLDWNTWLNQAADRPFSPVWMAWMQWRDFAGGEMTNWGAHGIDQVQWALGMDDTGPVAIVPHGAAPNAAVEMRYASGVPLTFVLDKGPMGGAVFIGDRGKLEINRNKVVSNPPEIAAAILASVDVAEEERAWSDETALWQARQHLQNWLDCIRTRERPVADVETGHRSITVCHLAGVARRLGRPLEWDPVAERFVSDPEADALLARPRRAGFELPEV
ncbi:MAG: Gfo/Idh/MocA family oxidoreductase [Planctomycetes bacterium]|nr:Gfo/Idh/MocA family oxidoreductase [Planctomycetota bacterium]